MGKSKSHRYSKASKTKLIAKESLTTKLIKLLIDPKPKLVFAPRYPDHSIYGYEVTVTLENPSSYKYDRVTTDTVPYGQGKTGFIFLQEASEAYNIEPSDLRDMCRKGLFEAKKVSNRWVINEVSLKSFLISAMKSRPIKRKI